MNDIQAAPIVTTCLAWRGGYLLAAGGVFLIDQVTKAWAVRTLRVTDDLRIVRGYLDLVYTENPGIAFGQLQQLGAFGRWFFVGLAIAAAFLAAAVRLRRYREPI